MSISRYFRISIYFAALLSVVLVGCSAGQASFADGVGSYSSVVSIKTTQLSNGVQIVIQSDGILQYRWQRLRGRTMYLNFPDARNGTGKNFYNIDSYPVSYLQLSTPQNATSGIGIDFNINNYIETSATVQPTPDGQGAIVTVLSDRTVDQGHHASLQVTGADASPSLNADTKTKVDYQDGMLSLRAVHVDIHQLLGAIAVRTGLCIAIDDAVDRKVSLDLTGVTPESAVRTIASAYGLALAVEDGIFMISEGVPDDLATYHLSGTESFRMQNTQAQTVSGLLPNFLYSYVKVNSEQNAVVVTAPSQMLAKIGSDLNRLDEPSPEIEIEAIAVELNDSSAENLGLQLNQQLGTSISTIDSQGGQITYTTIGQLPATFMTTLTALEQTGKARVRARPRMAVLNGRTANIFIGEQDFIQTQFNQSGQTQTRIQPVDVGVKLSITPLTGGNGEITTHIAPEVSNITSQDLQTGLPILSTRNADTTVRVKDGETIEIGGLRLDQMQETKGKIPFFGDLPVIGNLFRSKSHNLQQTELVIFITSHIINPSAFSVVQTPLIPPSSVKDTYPTSK